MSPTDKLLAAAAHLPSLPDIVQQMIASLADPAIELEALVVPLSRDQALTARVLRLANSSFYGASRRVGSVAEAVSLIGLDPLRNVVIACGLTGAFAGVRGVDLAAFWDHAATCAGLARRLARRVRIAPELCYSAALMHRIGRLLIHQALPEQALALAQDTTGCDEVGRAAREQALLGLDHCALGAELARRWNFPDDIQNALQWQLAPLDDLASPCALVVGTAVAINDASARGERAEAILAALSPALVRRLGLPTEVLLAEVSWCREMAQGA